MTTLQSKIQEEMDVLPLSYQKEILDFVLFLKEKAKLESDTEYLSKNTSIKQAIIEGLNTPLSECSEHLDG